MDIPSINGKGHPDLGIYIALTIHAPGTLAIAMLMKLSLKGGDLFLSQNLLDSALPGMCPALRMKARQMTKAMTAGHTR